MFHTRATATIAAAVDPFRSVGKIEQQARFVITEHWEPSDLLTPRISAQEHAPPRLL
jgi:hypothetical protein